MVQVPLSAMEIGTDVPRGMAFDLSGNLFVSHEDSIIKFTPDGTRSTFASGLKSLLGLAFDKGGNLFAADHGAGAIVKFNPDGSNSTFATGIAPAGIAFDSAGNLFVVDTNGSILKFAPEGTKSTFFKTITTKLGSTRLVDSAGPAIDKADNLFVSDKSSGSAAILKFSPDGTHSTFVSGLGNPTPWVLAFDRTDNLFVSILDQFAPEHTTIYKFAPDGPKTVELWRSEGEKFAVGVCAVGMTFDKAGNLFAFDTQSRSILKFTPDGTKSTFAWEASSASPDKKWEFVGGEEPKILNAATKQVVLEISEGRGGVDWAPDSKRFGFNYHVHGSHGYSFDSVAFYELRGNKWEELGSPANDVSEGSQLVQLLKEHPPRKFNPRDCSSNSDVLDLREWTDASTAILYAPCYRRNSGKVKAAFLFTLKFDEAGNWKIVKMHRLSEKELKEEQ
jgi:sugar lactone lactonase YvrE